MEVAKNSEKPKKQTLKKIPAGIISTFHLK